MSLDKKGEINGVENTNDGLLADEKLSNGTHEHDRKAVDALPPDPDDGLSDEERAIIVSLTDQAAGSPLTKFLQDKKLLRKLDFKLIPWVSILTTVSCSKLMAFSALLSLPHLFPRQDEHW
jgi:hypothetical protein